MKLSLVFTSLSSSLLSPIRSSCGVSFLFLSQPGGSDRHLRGSPSSPSQHESAVADAGPEWTIPTAIFSVYPGGSERPSYADILVSAEFPRQCIVLGKGQTSSALEVMSYCEARIGLSLFSSVTGSVVQEGARLSV